MTEAAWCINWSSTNICCTEWRNFQFLSDQRLDSVSINHCEFSKKISLIIWVNYKIQFALFPSTFTRQVGLYCRRRKKLPQMTQLPFRRLPLWFSRSVVSNSLWPHGLQHTRLPCPLLSPGVCSNSCPLSQWCHLTISSSVTPFSSCLQSFPASGSFPIRQLFTSSDQSIGASTSASVLPMNIQGWFRLGLTSLISSMSKGLSRVFFSSIKILMY